MTLSGYDTEDRFYATRYWQGGRRVYALDLAPTQIASYLPEPDPRNPTEGNRRIRESHAAAFGRYLREHESWVSPALLLRAPDIFAFKVSEEIAGTQFGVLAVPRQARSDIRILDGQHRILGVHLALRAIAGELEKQRDLLARASKNGEEEAVRKEIKAQIEKLEAQRERLDRERISLQIVIEDDSVAYRQIFVDIADNALGITSSVRTRFDHRKIVNRCVEPVLKHALLAERVDLEQDRIGGTSPSLLGAKHIADLIRTVQVGIDGRIGKRLEDELREDALVERTNRFLDVLIEGFAPLGQVADGELSPEQLRKSSLLGSSSMLRVLAGAYYELRSVQQWDDEQVAEYFRTLEPHMQAPLDAKSPWLAELGGEIFSEGALAPKARRQDLKALTDAIVRWALEPPPWLAAELTETSA